MSQPSQRQPAPLTLDSIYSRTQIVDGCRLWRGTIDRDGYGRLYVPTAGMSKLVHRIVYELASGPIPAGFHVDHLCWVRNCCEFAHLAAVPAAQNCAAQRQSLALTCARGHPYDAENTYWRPEPGVFGRRQCRACNRMAAERYQLKNGRHTQSTAAGADARNKAVSASSGAGVSGAMAKALLPNSLATNQARRPR